MLYLGIDQHKSQITVNLRSEDGDVILQRQVSTRWEKMQAFFEDLAQRAAAEGGFMAIYFGSIANGSPEAGGQRVCGGSIRPHRTKSKIDN